MPRFAVRAATVRDLDVLVLHRRRMWEDLGERDREVLDEADSVYRRWVRQRMQTGRFVGFIAEDARGHAAASGCVWLQPLHPRPGRPRGLVPYLLSMYTEPAYRRRGLATRITRHAIRWCRDTGHSRLTLHAAPQGRGVYRSLGFERTWEMRVRIGRPSSRKSRTAAARSRR